MKYLVIIQARCGSSRLPGKVLKDICGKTCLERVIDRVGRSRIVDEVMVATTMNQEDLPVVNLVSGLGVRVFAGSAEDVLDRYYQAAKLVKPEYVIRITADCPVVDPAILDDAAGRMAPDDDYCAALTETLADGLDIEVMKYDALARAWREAKLASEREHVTLYIKNHGELFKLRNYECGFADLHDERWTLDEERDYEFILKIYEHFTGIGRGYFSAEEIYGYLNENPGLRKINAGITRNEGLQASLRNDCRACNLKWNGWNRDGNQVK